MEKEWAARLTSLLGVGIHEERFAENKARVQALYNEVLEVMKKKYQYWPGEGAKLRFEAALDKAAQESSVSFPREYDNTMKRETYSGSSDLLKPFVSVPFVREYLNFKNISTLLNTFVKGFEQHIHDGRVHPRIRTGLKTGRVSFSSPNLQNIPRPNSEFDFRKAIIPTVDGTVFYGVDNTAAELVALADRCVREFGYSKMADAINKDIDLHKLTASQVTGKPYEEITKQERQLAKALNFGFPGGLGVASFVEYAKNGYGVDVTLEEAKKYKEDWLNAYPELRRYLKMGQKQIENKAILNLPKGLEKKQAFFRLKDIISGKSENRYGHEYTEEQKEWAWNNLRMAAAKHPHVFGQFRDQITAQKPSAELATQLGFLQTASLPSGRLRGKCTYSDFNNVGFQGAQSDVIGRAWYRLWRAGFPVAHMVHDEVQVLVPEDKKELARKIEEIILEAATYWCPNAKMKIESEFSSCWKK